MQMLKEQAKQHLQEILDQAVPGRFSNYTSSSGSSSYGSGTVDTRQLRARLENAINVMQTGLVERDTEVRAQERGQGWKQLQRAEVLVATEQQWLTPGSCSNSNCSGVTADTVLLGMVCSQQ